MTDELKRRMARLREIAPRLNAATDQASRLVAMVEKFLVEELHVGVSAEVCYEDLPAGTDEADQVLRQRHLLAFGRSGGSFRLHVVRETVAQDEESAAQTTLSQERILWPSCSRETKLKAFEKLPELLDRIIEEAERLAETSETTSAAVRDMIGEEEPTEAVHGRGRIADSGGVWSRQLADAARMYHERERDVVESETDSDAWEERMEAEGREDVEPQEDWEKAYDKLIRLVCIATGHDPAEPLHAPIAALTEDWLVVVSPGRDEPWDDEDPDDRQLSVIPRSSGLTIFS
jgi:hypothetical protein